MAIITLTSDLGLKDAYIPMVKGYIISHIPSANIVDITHVIQPFNIAEASFILSGCYRFFPQGTIHIVAVERETKTNPRYIITKTKEHFFISQDDGIVPLIIHEDDSILQVILLDYKTSDLLFPMLNIMSPAAVRMLRGIGPDELGKTQMEYASKSTIQPVFNESTVIGKVIYIDHSGNAITNIKKSLLEEWSGGKNYKVYIKNNDFISGIKMHYNEVLEGEWLCLFNSYGLLEIAINKGSSFSLLGLELESRIMVELIP